MPLTDLTLEQETPRRPGTEERHTLNILKINSDNLVKNGIRVVRVKAETSYFIRYLY